MSGPTPRVRLRLLAVGAALVLTACSPGGASGTAEQSPAPTPGTSSAPFPSPTDSTPTDSAPSPTPAESSGTASADRPRVPRQRLPPDPRWLYFEDDRTRYASPWWTGRHRLQIAYGCTPAPYYVLDPRCDGTGFHHGYDFAIPCGTPLRAARPARVVSSAALGPAYGENSLLLRMRDDDGVTRDVVIGHTRRNLVAEGDTLRAGQRFAYASDSAVYTGCHLHFEVRPAGGSVTSAVDPRPLLELRPRRDEL
ncbi:peptidoglycan DD-metalloendopeptidase family protein [Nocardioidaceae bacterium]|nr:peptidoglycan DD-metalloendopeptidase family protein [Nocardioidaceae bacterium]